MENLCPSVVQIAAPQLSRFWRGPSFNAAPPLSDSHLRQSVSFLCLPCGTPAENVADVTLEAVKVWDDQPSFEGLVDQNDARFDHPVDSEFFNKLRFDEKKCNFQNILLELGEVQLDILDALCVKVTRWASLDPLHTAHTCCNGSNFLQISSSLLPPSIP